MIYKRAVARLRAQDWLAITIELVIVVVGVFIGTWVANWNQDRLERVETRRMVAQLGPNLSTLNTYWPLARRYYAVTRAYGDTAIAGWHRDPSVSDAQFVLAAYQASQVYVIGLNGASFSKILGEDRLRQVDDPQLRSDLSGLMTSDFTQIDFASVDTPYRRNVRRFIPIDVQDEIRRQCGDRIYGPNLDRYALPARCDLTIPADRARTAAAALRAHPELLDDLQAHLGTTAVMLQNITALEVLSRRAAERSRMLAR